MPVFVVHHEGGLLNGAVGEVRPIRQLPQDVPEVDQEAHDDEAQAPAEVSPVAFQASL